MSAGSRRTGRAGAELAAPRIARDKIVDATRLLREVARARRRGERIVFTNGCFDLLHVGHVRSLEQARRLGDRLVVAVNDDASVRRQKGAERPIQPARVRRELVAALACVDWVVGFRAATPIGLIRATRPDVLAKGGDWSLDEIVGREEVEATGGRVVRLDVVPGERTTQLVERIRRGARRS
ncbi:MAG: D-glycero-beta-D-manno-heptose 1-phosphate adenylyltransferase [Myxococcota bacterium]